MQNENKFETYEPYSWMDKETPNFVYVDESVNVDYRQEALQSHAEFVKRSQLSLSRISDRAQNKK